MALTITGRYQLRHAGIGWQLAWQAELLAGNEQHATTRFIIEGVPEGALDSLSQSTPNFNHPGCNRGINLPGNVTGRMQQEDAAEGEKERGLLSRQKIARRTVTLY